MCKTKWVCLAYQLNKSMIHETNWRYLAHQLNDILKQHQTFEYWHLASWKSNNNIFYENVQNLPTILHSYLANGSYSNQCHFHTTAYDLEHNYSSTTQCLNLTLEEVMMVIYNFLPIPSYSWVWSDNDFININLQRWPTWSFKLESLSSGSQNWSLISTLKKLMIIYFRFYFVWGEEIPSI